MPRGLSAHRPTAYPARREASTTAAGHVPQHPQARAQETAGPSAAFFSQPGTAPPEPQQHRDQPVAAEPGPPRSQRHHERAGRPGDHRAQSRHLRGRDARRLPGRRRDRPGRSRPRAGHPPRQRRRRRARSSDRNNQDSPVTRWRQVGRRPRVKASDAMGILAPDQPGRRGCCLVATTPTYTLSAVRERVAGYGSSSRNPWCSAKSLKSLRLRVASGSW